MTEGEGAGTEPVVDGSELAALDAVETAARIRAGDLKASEVVGAAVERARTFEAALNAVATPTFEAALAQASRVQAGSAFAFAGVPSFIKGLDNLAGVENDQGSRAYVGNVPRTSEAWVAGMLETGFVILGKSAAPEAGLTGTTEPLLRGVTHNPWNRAHTPGGSSGGAAALVASRVVPLAHASDGGGSIRIPAAYCGLVGLKPSRERRFAPAFGEWLPLRALTNGAVTRTVRDTAHFVHAVEKRRPTPKLPPIGLVERAGTRPLRIGLYTDSPLGSEGVHPELREAVRQVGRDCEALGHPVDEIACPYPREILDDFWHYWGQLAWGFRMLTRLHRKWNYDPTELEPWTHGLAERSRGLLGEVAPALRRLRATQHTTAALFDRHDLLLCPTTSQPPPRLGYLAPDRPFEVLVERVTETFPFTPLQNATGRPAISLPLALTQTGLPIGVQFEAAHGREAALLEIAYALEESVGFFSQPGAGRSSN